VIGTNTAYTIKDLCAVAFAHAGLDWQTHVEIDPQFMRPTEIAAARGNYARAKAELGWEPRTTFADLVKLMVDADLRRLSRKDPSTGSGCTLKVSKH
jgi:GDPmannose 4,6-dehydratase